MKPTKDAGTLMLIPAALGYLGVSIPGILNVQGSQQRLWVAVLLALFGICFFVPPLKKIPYWGLQASIALETALVAALLFFDPGWSVFPILFFLMGPQVMVWFSPRIGLAWVGVFTLVTAVIFLTGRGLVGLVSLLPYFAGYVFFANFGWVSVQATRAQRRSAQLLAELQEAHRQLQDYASRVEELTIAQERNRIAREMHDALGHRLTIASVQLEGAQRLVHSDPDRAGQILGTVREQVREGLKELRRTVAMLRASPDEDLPLQQALLKLVGQVQEATGVQIHLSLEDCPPDLPAAYRQAFYRAAQEGLTNVQRHAKASEAWLHFSQRDGWQTLLLGDNGVGIPTGTSQAGFGLSGLKERAALLDGHFFVDPRPGGGTQLTFRLPILEEIPHVEPPCNVP
jgi:signal transduction histidine kinase